WCFNEIVVSIVPRHFRDSSARAPFAWWSYMTKPSLRRSTCWRILLSMRAWARRRQWGLVLPEGFRIWALGSRVKGKMEEFIFLSALNQYDYCSRRCYYIFVENIFVENEHT